MSSPDTGRAAYVQFRLNNPLAVQAVASQIAQVEVQIAQAQATVARQRAAAVLREQGLLFAWARVRVDAHRELAALVGQPWFKDLADTTNQTSGNGETLGLAERVLPLTDQPENGSLRLTARLHDGGQLCLWLRPSAWPMVQVEPLPGSAAGSSALFVTVLAGLAAEGHLADVVAACAQRFGLTLADRANGEPRQIDGQAERQYFLQRAAWLMAPDPAERSGLTESDVAIAQLNELQRRLFVLDEQRRRLEPQYDNQAQVRLYEQEYERLCSLPHVSSLAVRGHRVELRTGTIHVRGICVGSFCVNYDFSTRSLLITNLTKPVYSNSVRFDHPHIRNGYPCLGNIGRAISDLLASRDLPKLIPLTLDFLLSYNPSQPFRRLDCWAEGQS